MATGRIGTTPVLTTRWSKAPSAGTTSLSGLDDNSVSLVYSVGYEAVYQNGVLLSRGNDYTATNGTTITLTTATVAGDIIEVFANQTIPLTDTYSQTVANSLFVNQATFDAKGDLIAGTADNTYSRLAVGTNGQVLTAASTTSTGLAWATPSSGYNLISRQTFTSTGTQTFDNIFSDTYDNYQIVLLYGNTQADELADLHMQFRYGATPTTQTQYYNSNYTYQTPNGGTATNSGQLDEGNIRISIATGTQYVVHMFISRYSDRLWGGYFATGYSNNGSADPFGYRGNFQNRFARSGANAYHGLYFYNTGGSATGNISIYGQAKS